MSDAASPSANQGPPMILASSVTGSSATVTRRMDGEPRAASRTAAGGRVQRHVGKSTANFRPAEVAVARSRGTIRFLSAGRRGGIRPLVGSRPALRNRRRCRASVPGAGGLGGAPDRGPAVGDNALVATPLADLHHVPTINWPDRSVAAAPTCSRCRSVPTRTSRWCCRYLSEQSVARIGIVYDRSPIGRRYLEFSGPRPRAQGVSHGDRVCRSGCRRRRLPSRRGARLRPRLRGLPGFGILSARGGRAFASSGWDGLRVMNTSGMRGHDASLALRSTGGFTWTCTPMATRPSGDTRPVRDARRTGLHSRSRV